LTAGSGLGTCAHRIPFQDQPLTAAVPHGKSEHAAQLGETGLAQLFIQVDDGLSVGARSKTMPAGQKAFVQFLEVVDLAVKYDPDALIFVGEWLVATF
jgi:hypothetical protein